MILVPIVPTTMAYREAHMFEDAISVTHGIFLEQRTRHQSLTPQLRSVMFAEQLMSSTDILKALCQLLKQKVHLNEDACNKLDEIVQWTKEGAQNTFNLLVESLPQAPRPALGGFGSPVDR